MMNMSSAVAHLMESQLGHILSMDDPFRLHRFCMAAERQFEKALSEIEAGEKMGCWSWYFFPVAPFVVDGVERGSCQNQEWALRDLPPNNLRGDDAARAFLKFEAIGISLREIYIKMMSAVAEQLEMGVRPSKLVGCLDDPKLRSSLRLFERVTRDGFDEKVNALCCRALELLKEPLVAMDDPFRLRRFCIAAERQFEEALSEIESGEKMGCWSWFFFPVAPWVVDGRERGSSYNQEWALRDLPPNNLRGDDAARAFLKFEAIGINLREMYIKMMSAVADQLEKGVRPLKLVGCLDDPKLRSSLRLFERVTRDGFDEKVNALCCRALELLEEPLDAMEDPLDEESGEEEPLEDPLEEPFDEKVNAVCCRALELLEEPLDEEIGEEATNHVCGGS
jgi:uncharacterized protein (DUF1810 family)